MTAGCRSTQEVPASSVNSVNIEEADAHFSQWVDQVRAGTDIVFVRHGVPVARITRLIAPDRKITFGVLKGGLHIDADFDAPLPDDVIASFEC